MKRKQLAVIKSPRKRILKEKRAEYGEEIVSALGTQLTLAFDGGFGKGKPHEAVRLARERLRGAAK